MATLKPLQSVTLTSASSSVVFSNISQDYTDLIVEVDAAESTGNYVMYLEFNGDTTNNNYSDTYMLGTGSSAGSNRYNGINDIAHRFFAWGRSTARSISKIHINSYSNSTTYKTWLSRSSQPALGTSAHVGLWRSTAAITTIKFQIESSNYGAGTTFSLYGIKAGTPKATGGDVITTDGTYWYHAFKNSGTFTVQQDSALTVDYLVVAGGGAGGYDCGGGGGAGGYRTASNFSCAGGSSSVVLVGAGGANTMNRGLSGSNSVFASITSTGGGGGGSRVSTYGAGADGGSGGGGGGDNLGAGGAASPAGQGNAGGRGSAGVTPGGGGGGAGAAGTNTTNEQTPGNGGAGLNTLSSWASATGTGASGYYAGGGGGGYNAQSNGGAGGGGYGGGGPNYNSYRAPASGTANTGGGGGGGTNSVTPGSIYAGAGGSGIVIVRYAV